MGKNLTAITANLFSFFDREKTGAGHAVREKRGGSQTAGSSALTPISAVVYRSGG